MYIFVVWVTSQAVITGSWGGDIASTSIEQVLLLLRCVPALQGTFILREADRHGGVIMRCSIAGSIC